MKKAIYRAFLTAVVALLGASCSTYSNRGTVDRPFVTSANQTSLGIENVELTDSSTTLCAVIHTRPGSRVSLSSQCAIMADGVSYPIQSTDWSALDSQVTVPDSGIIRFSMVYPPIPADVRSIDFTEGTDNGWQIWGIDLTGEADHFVNQHGITSRLRKDTSRPLPETLIVSADSTTVNAHILGYRPEMGSKLSWAVNTLHGQDLVDSPVDADGNTTVKLAISAPAQLMPIGLDNIHLFGGMSLVAPGETMELYIDSHTSGIANMNEVFGETGPDDYIGVYVDGTYPNLRQNTGENIYGMDFYSGSFGDYHMDGDAYTAYITGTYKSLSDSIAAATNLTEMGRQYCQACLMADLVCAAVTARSLLSRNYYNVNGSWGTPIPADSITMKLSPENVRAIAELIDFNNNDMLLSANLLTTNLNTALWENAGVDPGVLKTLALYRKAYSAAKNAELDQSMTDALRGLNSPLADEVEAHNAAVKARLEAIDPSLLTPTPDVAPDKVFDVIIAPHKGKVVMVDLWNTWCGPCRKALAANEPEKSGDLSSDDIVWIYLANQTSPNAQYMTMINDIKGIHYKLNEDQWRAITSRFDVDGIPFYILVDRQGNAVGRPDLRDHDAFKKAILDKLAN